MSQKQPPKHQMPDAKGMTRSNDKPINTQEQGQPGNIYQNTTHARNQQDR